MKKKIVVVGGADEIVGFRLAGVKEAYDVGSDDVLEKLNDGESIVFLTRVAADKLGDKVGALRRKTIVQEIPEGVDYERINELIRDTVGFNIKR